MSAIEVKDLTFVYSKKTPYEKLALDNVSVNINEGEFLGIIGHTGSGKSTFIQHINGLIKPQVGLVKVFDIDLSIKKPKPDLRKLRGQVGMVFQYPEYQLFAETVEKDVAFGAVNMKFDSEEVKKRTREAIELVGLDYNAIATRSPFDLSGGQKRRVAIAGVIVMNPKILILDEPTAGLDPQGKQQILNLIMHLKEARGLTVVVISHDIDEVSKFADRIIVFNKACIEYDIPMIELFKHSDALRGMGLDIPMAVNITNSLRERGIKLDDKIINDDDLVKAVLEYLNKNKGGHYAYKAKSITDKTMNVPVTAVENEDFDFFGGNVR